MLGARRRRHAGMNEWQRRWSDVYRALEMVYIGLIDDLVMEINWADQGGDRDVGLGAPQITFAINVCARMQKLMQ